MRRLLLSLLPWLLLAGCADKPYVVQPPVEEEAGSGRYRVHVVSHGWHTGFVLPATALLDRFPQLRQRFGQAPYLEVGWGDGAFYQADEISWVLGARAALWPTDTVLHLVAVPRAPAEYFAASDVVALCLTDTQYERLRRFVSQSFQIDYRGVLAELGPGLYGQSRFYRADGRFHLFNTCNKWTAKGLKSAGYELVPFTKLTATSVMDWLRGEGSVSERRCP